MNQHPSQFQQGGAQQGYPPMMFNQQGMAQGPTRTYPTLYVGDLEDAINEEMLYNFFINYGPIYSVRIMRDSQNKKSRGFAYLSFYNQKDAENARLNSNHKCILQNPIRVTVKKNIRELGENIFIKNLDKDISASKLENFFNKFGSVFSSKVALDEQNDSRGYAYIQFETRESSENCLKQVQNNYITIEDRKFEVYPFQKKDKRPEIRNNLYIRHIPIDLTKEEIEEKLRTAFETVEGAKIQRMVVGFQQVTKNPYSFVQFFTKEDAEKVINKYNGTENLLFTHSLPLFVNWFQTKQSRQEEYSKMTNDTNLFTKNLNKDVQVQDLIDAFKVYGDIDVSKVKICTPNQDEKVFKDKIKLDTVFAYIKFERSQDAKSALLNCKNDETIKKLYHSQIPQVYFHVRKSQFKNMKSSKQRINQKKVQSQQMDPMVVFMMTLQQLAMQGFPMQSILGGGGFGGGFGGGMGGGAPMIQGPRNPGYQANRRQGGNNQNPQNKPYQQPYRQGGNRGGNQQPRPAVQKAPTASKLTIQSLKENLQEFLAHDKNKQSTMLGELLYPMVKELAKDKNLAPKITGMLIDFEVFEVTDIIELLESKEHLVERVEEAEDLITTAEATPKAGPEPTQQ